MSMPYDKSIMSWYLYVLRCADNSLYTGITTDVERRIYEHNNTNAGAKYTKSKRPVTSVAVYLFLNRSEATKAELKFKKLRKQQKENVVKGICKVPW